MISFRLMAPRIAPSGFRQIRSFSWRPLWALASHAMNIWRARQRQEEAAGGLPARGGWLRAPEKGRAPAPQGHVLALVARGGASQVDARADLARAAERRWGALRHSPRLSDRTGLWPHSGLP